MHTVSITIEGVVYSLSYISFDKPIFGTRLAFGSLRRNGKILEDRCNGKILEDRDPFMDVYLRLQRMAYVRAGIIEENT